MESFTKWLTLSICLVGILYVLWKITDDDEEDAKTTSSSSSNTEPFIPTHEWQEVKPGQAVPPGLSIRFDFETGKNYAKLLDKETTTENAVKVEANPFD